MVKGWAMAATVGTRTADLATGEVSVTAAWVTAGASAVTAATVAIHMAVSMAKYLTPFVTHIVASNVITH